MNFQVLGFLGALATFTAACGGSTTTISEVTSPGAVRCQTSVANAPSTVPHSGSRVNLTVVAERDCTWTAASEASWAQVTPTSGQGEGTVAITVAENPDTRSRSGAIVVNTTRLSLTQEAAPCRFSLGSSRQQLSHTAGRTSVSVSTANGCAWRASSNADWARVVNDNGSGSGAVEIDVAANQGAVRTATITIADQTLTLVQSSRGNDPPSEGTCSLSLDPAERTFGASGGDASVRVVAPNGCAWNASASAPWVEVAGGAGTGTDSVRYRVAANTSTSPRSATITIGSRTHTVRQEGAAASGGGGGGGGGGGEETRVELSGRALLVDGSCPSISFIVDLRRVFTTGDTRFRGGSCGDVRNLRAVRVEGRLQSDGRVRATEVRLVDDDDDDGDD